MHSITKIIVALGVFVVPSMASSGDMTYYTPGLGACGETNTESDDVVAMSPNQYGNCGKTINIHYDGKTVSAKVVDKCPGCTSNGIDVSPKVFEELADPAEGRVSVTWEYA
ncbi:RlpA-like double-psi beta-barrel-protein domain-containing protein-containing protein [Hypoxylon crocopeplum]|nr:RlpA-like double-psi beta-barrel-protein domain-containing protein-containing protein [Hypoxylon crocopeplum]